MCRAQFFAVLLFAIGCSDQNGESVNHGGTRTLSPSSNEELTVAPMRIDAQYLPNPVQVHTNVISGGLPKGDEAFRELKSLGVQTVISVDGTKPDVKTANKYGIRYVHLPHGYDGISEARVKELAKAVRELDGPIYIHCHHGKHRSPAAASVACVAAGLIPESKAVAILELRERVLVIGASTNQLAKQSRWRLRC